MKAFQLFFYPTIFMASATMVTTTDAFSVTPSTRPTSASTAGRYVPIRSPSLLKESSTADQTSAYEKLGIAKEQLAMGVNPGEVLDWIGTREEMIEKATQDISKFDRSKAEAEVDKYLKDPEMLNYHIEFKKRLAENPDMLVGEEAGEGFFNFQTLVTVYITYVLGNIVYKNYLHDYVDLSFIPGYALKDAVESGAEAAQGTVAAAATIVDAVSNSM